MYAKKCEYKNKKWIIKKDRNRFKKTKKEEHKNKQINKTQINK